MVALAVWLVSAAIVGVAAMVALYAVAAIVIAILLAVAGPLILLVAPFQIARESAAVVASEHVLTFCRPSRRSARGQAGSAGLLRSVESAIDAMDFRKCARVGRQAVAFRPTSATRGILPHGLDCWKASTGNSCRTEEIACQHDYRCSIRGADQ